MNVWRLAWRVSQHHPRSFWLGWTAFVVFFTAPAAIGWILGRSFDAISRGDGGSVTRWLVLLVTIEVLRMVSIHVGAVIWTEVWVRMQSFLRSNLLAAQLASGGPEAGPPVASAGGALTHFRDDTEDVAMFVDGMVDVSGGVVFTAVAAFVLGATNLPAALVLVVPLTAVAVATRVLDGRITRYRAADRAAAAEVSGFVGDVMAAATTVKVNDATDPVVDHLGVLVERRRRTAVRDRVLEDGVRAFSGGVAEVGLGLVLVVSAGGLAAGTFDVGQLALFAAYLGWLGFLPRMVGTVLARRKQAGVAFDRMSRLVADGDPSRTVRPRALPIGRRERVDAHAPIRPERVPLERVDLVGLTVHHPSGFRVGPVDLTVRRGEFVVITGPVGAGKTSLLRAVLGAAGPTEVTGEIRWNGRRVEDPASFMVPPNAASLPQVPRLLSDTIADNIGLGPIDAAALGRAVRLASFDRDLAAFPEGAATLVGPRGLRLSGGQRQRLATARALAHAPELVVVDDLSSALDVETEIELWERLADAGMTVLAVSHRAVAFDRADQVLVLEAGRVADHRRVRRDDAGLSPVPTAR